MPDNASKPCNPGFEYKVRILNKFRKPIRALLDENGIPERERDYYWLMIHWVTKGLIKSYKDTYLVTRRAPKFSEWFCRLYSKIMDGAMGHKYIEVFENLRKWEVIVRGASYCKGEDGRPGRCKAVWFGEKYGTMLKEYCFAKDIAHLYGKGNFSAGCLTSLKLTSKILLKRLEKCAIERKHEQLADPVVQDAHDNLLHFSIDRAKAIGALRKSKRMTPRRFVDEMRKVDRFNDARTSETSLFVVRDDYGRVHTNMTQMKKEVRKYAMTCDGDPVGSVDIKSSQASFLCYIIGSYLAGEDTVIGRNGKSFIDMDPRLADSIGRSRLEYEYAVFRGKIEHSGLYEFFADEMNLDSDLNGESEGQRITRDMAKQAFLATLFAGVHLNDDCDRTWHACRRVWEEHWPSLLAMVDSMKRRNYRALAYEMQRMESSFVFDVVIPKIRTEIGCHYCTVHDEIIVPDRYVNAVKHIVDRELARFKIPTTTTPEHNMLVPGDDVLNVDMPALQEVGYYCDWGDRADMEIADTYAHVGA